MNSLQDRKEEAGSQAAEPAGGEMAAWAAASAAVVARFRAPEDEHPPE